jgi:predicted enzyme related to lactoylglutathione lyase
LTLAAALPLWPQSRQQGGENMAHPVVHFEIGCRDRAKTEQFFSDLFGWHIGPASAIDTGSPGGIPGHITSLGHEPQHYTMFYVEVDDVQASLDKATSLGGKTVVPPVKIPTGTFAWFSDPDDNTIGLLKRG